MCPKPAKSASTNHSRRSLCIKKFVCITSVLVLVVASIPHFYHQITQVSAKTTDCTNVHFVFARGSGSSLNAGDHQSWHTNLQQILKRSTLKTTFYELGTDDHGGAKYPAVGIGNDSPFGIFTAVGALVSAGESYKFGTSIQQGIDELKNYITEVATKCPQTKFVLGGYSQGAMVISKALPQLDANKIIYAATFGDPKLYLPEGQGSDPPACHRQNLSNYRADIPDCYTDEGILGGLQPYQPDNYLDKLGAWCNDQDLMCGSSWNFTDLLGAHLGYTSQNRYAHAANVISQKLATAFPAQTSPSQTNISTHDLAILIDTSGSMTDLIDNYRAEAKKLATKIIDKGGRVALYQYRDLSDPYQPNQVLDFTSDLSEFEHALASLNTNGGGDDDESTLNALLHTMNTLKWQAGATKSIVLLTDAGYHFTDHDGTTLADVVKRSHEIDPVNIYTLTPDYITDRYAELTAKTYGRTFSASDELELSTDYISKHDDLILDSPATTKATIDHLQVTNTSNSAVVSFTSTNTAKILLVLNDTPLGFVDNNFTITNLQGQNSITLIPISSQGRKGASATYDFYAGIKVPDCGFKQNRL